MKNLCIFLVVSALMCFIWTKNIYAETLDYKTLSITTNGEIAAVHEENDILYVGGSFTTIELDNGPIEERSNIAAISLIERSILGWNPALPIEVKSIEFTEDSVIAKNYDEKVDANDADRTQYSINKATAEVTSLVVVTATPTPTVTPIPITSAVTSEDDPQVQGLMVDRSELGFQIPTLSDILTFAIRGFFVIAGLAALFFLLMGAFTWVTSGGDKDSVQAARDKMQAAVVGVLMMVVVLAIVWTLEQVILGGNLCFGISCPVSLPRLIDPT